MLRNVIAGNSSLYSFLGALGWLLFCLAGCKSPSKASPIVSVQEVEPLRLEGAERLPTLDFGTRIAASESQPELYAVAGEGEIRWYKGAKELDATQFVGSAHALECVDLDGDGQSDWVLGAGRSRDAKQAPLSLLLFLGGDDKNAPIEVSLPQSTRADFVAISHSDVGLVVAFFLSKFEVGIYRLTLEKRTPSLSKIAQRRVVGDIGALGTEVVVTSLYGKHPDLPGGVELLRGAESSLALPAQGGARGVAVLGESQVVYGDGWKKRYAKEAKGLLTFVTKGPKGWHPSKIISVKDRFGFKRIRHRKHRGTSYLLISGEGPGLLWSAKRSLRQLHSGISRDIDIVNMDSDGALEIIVLGDEALRIQLPL